VRVLDIATAMGGDGGDGSEWTSYGTSQRRLAVFLPAGIVWYAAIVVNPPTQVHLTSDSTLLHPSSPPTKQKKKQRSGVCVIPPSSTSDHGGYVFFPLFSMRCDRIGWVMIVMTRGGVGVYGVYIPFLRRLGFGMAFMGFFWDGKGV
jgi:hypothetical protein